MDPGDEGLTTGNTPDHARRKLACGGAVRKYVGGERWSDAFVARCCVLLLRALFTCFELQHRSISPVLKTRKPPALKSADHRSSSFCSQDAALQD